MVSTAAKTPNPKSSFTDRFLTHDNFWNIMFFEMVLIGFIIATFFESVMVFWICFVISSFITYKRQKLSINADGVFINTDKGLLNDRYPVLAWGWFILSGFASIGVAYLLHILTIDSMISMEMTRFIMFSISLLMFLSYFLYINCPISILFFARAWTPEVIGIEGDSNRSDAFKGVHRDIFRDFMRENPITDPRWSGSSSNIFNSSHRR
ncbi:MAG: hypothetical protein SFT91_00010 [Rickettsiaceae bacterium]|nr:hypothetical protein [Rickettsiaceae bacterium]